MVRSNFVESQRIQKSEVRIQKLHCNDLRAMPPVPDIAAVPGQSPGCEAGRMEKRAAIAGRRVTRHKALFPCTRA